MVRSAAISCDALRGGMDASQYKDYVLVFLFVKYVSDKAKSQKRYDLEVPKGASFEDNVGLKGAKDIGEKMPNWRATEMFLFVSSSPPMS